VKEGNFDASFAPIIDHEKNYIDIIDLIVLIIIRRFFCYLIYCYSNLEEVFVPESFNRNKKKTSFFEM